MKILESKLLFAARVELGFDRKDDLPLRVIEHLTEFFALRARRRTPREYFRVWRKFQKKRQKDGSLFLMSSFFLVTQSESTFCYRASKGCCLDTAKHHRGSRWNGSKWGWRRTHGRRGQTIGYNDRKRERE